MLEWARTRLSDIEAMKTDDLNPPAKKYLAKDLASRVMILPEKHLSDAGEKK